MILMDILTQVVAGAAAPEQHFDQVAKSASPDLLGHGVAEAFRSDQTPEIGQMVGQLFGQSNSAQQAGLLNQILASVGPAVLASAAGGALGKILAPGATQVTPDQASKLSPGQVQDIVTHANQTQPGLADQLGQFYAQHSSLVKTLGGAALVIALAKMRERLS
ncbi:MAG: hypothetical protein IPL03_00555 [Sterolibacteriaceae bacterium]|nr:hypothetical protein [Candidatus Methylophosphatis haderslevensis]